MHDDLTAHVARLLGDVVAVDVAGRGRAALIEVGSLLRAAAAAPLPWHEWRVSLPATTSMVLLGQAAAGGPALYAVSDAPGLVTPPHEHRTWSVALGVEGLERNVFHAHAAGRCTAVVGEQVVGPGDVAIMEAHEAHAVEVVSAVPTLHLHLYGVALDRLPPFAARVLLPHRR